MVAGIASPADWLIIAPVALSIVFGALLLMLRHEIRTHATVALVGLGGVVLANAGLLNRVLAEGPVVMTMGRWLPPFGISFTVDALGASFALVGSAVAFICGVVASKTIDGAGLRYGFYPFLMMMMAGVNGAFLTGDIFNLYVWFEVFLISSFGLLVLGSRREQIDGATKYAILNFVATTLFLIATGLLYGTFGTLNMADLARKAHEVRDSGPLMTLAVLYLLAFGMKAAAFPVNFWLPASYHTPRIVIAALFAGLLTKIGVYALLRSLVMIFPVERATLSGMIGWVAAATMILGIMGALSQSDTRRIFGFVVISGVGVMLAGVSLGGADGISGTILYGIHSMLVMTALYLLAGIMRDVGGSFSLHELSGLYRASPLLAAAAFVLVLAVSGLPPGSGLWPKVLLVKAALASGAWWLASAILVSGLLTTVVLGRVFALAFWRQEGDQIARQPSAHPKTAFAALGALMVPIVLIGLFPEPFIRLADAAASGLLDASGYVRAVFPGEVR